MDYDVDNYTIDELYAILKLPNDGTVTDEDILVATNNYIDRFKKEGNEDMSIFFQNIQDRLSAQEPEKDPPTNYVVPVVRDNLNPNLQNVTTRFILLDSQYRQSNGGTNNSTSDYTVDLNTPLTNTLNLRLYSLGIPFTWYVIDNAYGNTCFWITNVGKTFRVTLPPGNYNPKEFCDEFNKSLVSAGFETPDVTMDAITYDAKNGKLTLMLSNLRDPDGAELVTTMRYLGEPFDSDVHAYMTFFDFTGNKTCYSTGCTLKTQGHTFSSTLGWLMGFRLPLQPIFTNGNTPACILNLYGTKYFMIALEDYNQNRINNNLVTIAELAKPVALPSYYNTSQPFVCKPTSTMSLLNENPTEFINYVGNLSNLTDEDIVGMGLNEETFYNTLQDKLNMSGQETTQEVLPSAPRTLTQSQLYVINEIIKTRNKTLVFKPSAPTSSDIFAIIPIKYGSMSSGQLYTELSGQFQDNRRIYFGPVNIERLRLRLLDDKGNNVDLHGADWCVTLLGECLYKY